MADSSKTLSFVSAEWDKTITPTISEYISIPNQSPAYDPEWATNGHMDRAIELLINWVKAQEVPNLTIEVIREEGRTPVIFIEIPAAAGNKTSETILMYGHMDKQPPLTEAWDQGLHPYTPIIRDGKLYGRGGADDGYSTFAAVCSVKALLAQGVVTPRISIVIEACEESGSGDLDHYMTLLSPRLGDVGLIICLDSGCGNYEQFWLTTSLRGIVGGVLRVKTVEQGVHSGSSSGVVPSSFRVARQLFDRLEDSKTGKMLVPELFVDIPAPRIEQAKQAAQFLGDVIWNEFPLVKGSRPMGDDNTDRLLNKTWRPTLSVTGASGFPPAAVAGNVLRVETAFKLSIRLPPSADPARAGKAVKETLERDPPHGVQVVFEEETPMPGWASPILAPWLETSIQNASNAFWGKPAVQMGEGGSIPFMGLLGQQFPKAQFVITGVLGPGSNAHGPNEFLHLEMGKRVTACISQIVADFGVEKNK
eukprot:TRINITY_DN102_c0_g2_i1.p2 TRINITY_DN102_c0_g2~~TRINITY_DN102_c0_g2_i1.p2  ORF type:complete len:478 (-),score=207.75 TRINITY_DN102_c0_g2_i1:204-1637(-)